MFKSVTCKLGNMRKSVEWTIYPRNENDQFAQIQCDSRIAKINLNSGKTLLSKAGLSNFAGLMPHLGATEVVCPQDVIQSIKATGHYKEGEHLAHNVYVGEIRPITGF